MFYRPLFWLVLYLTSITIPVSADTGVYKPDETCDRFYVYKGTTQAIDVGRGLNGEGLRPILRSNSDAERLLNDYQAGSKTKAIFAYVGTAGLATILIGGLAVAPNLSDTRVGRQNVRYAFMGLGALIIAGGYAWSQIKIKNNEQTLKAAVSTYNHTASENNRIRMGVELDPKNFQGQIKTEVQL